jgi:hypothetical protein
VQAQFPLTLNNQKVGLSIQFNEASIAGLISNIEQIATGQVQNSMTILEFATPKISIAYKVGNYTITP